MENKEIDVDGKQKELKHGFKTKERSGTIISLNFKEEIEALGKLEEFIEKCNDKEFGKKITPLNVIVYALNLLKESDVIEIQSMTLTSKDRFMKLLSDAKKSNSILSDDEFYEIAIKTIRPKLPSKNVQ